MSIPINTSEELLKAIENRLFAGLFRLVRTLRYFKAWLKIDDIRVRGSGFCFSGQCREFEVIAIAIAGSEAVIQEPSFDQVFLQ